MARQTKTHIRNPTARKESLCGRTAVLWADDDKPNESTCKKCIAVAATGQLQRLKVEADSEGKPQQTGANNTGTPRITDMQLKFAKDPIVLTNPQQAALNSGYSETYAKQHATALRKQLAPLIMDMQEAAKRVSAISVARVQTELAAMGFANIIDYFNIDPLTGEMTPKQLNELTRDQAAAIQEVKIIDITDEETGEKRYVIGSVKLADKRANLVELGKTLGMFNKITIEDKRESTLLMSDVPTGALEDAEALLLAAAAKSRNERANRNAIEGEFTKLPSPDGEKHGTNAKQE